ncbi:MAG: helix-hairpin-helix domain-containing protein, partial [Desulfobacteraceae bacterium]
IKTAGGLTHGNISLKASEDFTPRSGIKVTVRSDGKECKVSHSEMSAFYKVTLGIPLSLNRESEEGLTAIPGIGAKLAKAIVVERSKRGGFKDLDEVPEIPGIGRRLYKKIRPYVTLEHSVSESDIE